MLVDLGGGESLTPGPPCPASLCSISSHIPHLLSTRHTTSLLCSLQWLPLPLELRTIFLIYVFQATNHLIPTAFLDLSPTTPLFAPYFLVKSHPFQAHPFQVTPFPVISHFYAFAQAAPILLSADILFLLHSMGQTPSPSRSPSLSPDQMWFVPLNLVLWTWSPASSPGPAQTSISQEGWIFPICCFQYVPRMGCLNTHFL